MTLLYQGSKGKTQVLDSTRVYLTGRGGRTNNTYNKRRATASEVSPVTPTSSGHYSTAIKASGRSPVTTWHDASRVTCLAGRYSVDWRWRVVERQITASAVTRARHSNDQLPLDVRRVARLARWTTCARACARPEQPKTTH